ncbi:MAG: chorismate synthase [Chitinophagales bacterium]|nr:chorismate synthase [Chitinophagales bacterium]
MAGNSFGSVFKLTSFGESHGKAVGMVLDGCPAGITLCEADIQVELNRRRPGQSTITTQRKEADEVQILSGVFEGLSLGTPIAVLIHNHDQESKDYSHLKDAFRPSHADFTYQEKYGHRDYRGGGRASARETVARVAAGAIAKKYLSLSTSIKTRAYVSSIAHVDLETKYTELNLDLIESNLVRCPDPEKAAAMIALIEESKAKGDSLGGIISCVIENCPIGLGEPVFDKLEAQLAKAMLSIPAVKGFSIGSGFEGTKLKGSEHNDAFEIKEGRVHTKTNHSGGIQGGISNGMDIYFEVAFKPTATIMQKQESIDSAWQEISLEAKGRHDPCVLPRAIPIVEAMANLVLADNLLLSKLSKL